MRLVKRCVILAAFGLALPPLGAWAQDSETPEGWFPFWIPAYDAAESFTDMSFLNPKPAGADGRVTIRNGDFVEPSGRQLRLLGTNLCFEGPFPEKDDAPRIAAHLRKLGFNIIRFHHIDGRTAPRGLRLPDKADIDPEQLDKLDWLIFQLKQHGIYSNINLHVSFTYPGISKSMPRAFRYGKGVDNFYPEFIDMQKRYARALLGHTNPYTGATYAEEPAVLVVEINNENALTEISTSSLRELPEPFLGELERQWRGWLRARYRDTDALRARWDEAKEPLGDELLENGAFADGVNRWYPQAIAPARMSTEVVEVQETQSKRALKVSLEQEGGVSYGLQLHQTGLDLQEGAPYTVSFRIRSEKPRDVSVSVMLDVSDWHACGFRQDVGADPEWRVHSYTFKCRDPKPNHCRLSFNFKNKTGVVWLADVSLRRGGILGLGEEYTIEGDNIPIPPPNASDPEQEDFLRFLQETELRYVRTMRDHLKKELGVGAHICCTQASYGRVFGLYREATLSDYLDMHSYWQHPHFPGKPWDGKNWNIPNTSMVASTSGGTFTRLAWCRCFGKPYTVSEYDHPAPNDHAVELFPMYASFAAFQGWNGIYQFNYRSGSVGEEKRRMSGYFELWSHPGKQVFLPIAALMFRMSAVSEGRDRVVMKVPTGDMAREMAVHGRDLLRLDDAAMAALEHPGGFRLVDGPGRPDVPEHEAADIRRSDTGQITWKAAPPEEAVYTVNASAVRAAVGYIGGQQVRLGDVTLSGIESAKGWAAVAVGALDGNPVSESARVLVVAAGRVENTDMEWNEDRTSVSNKWGGPPVIAEGVRGVIRIPGKRKVDALDGTGAAVKSVPVRHVGGYTEFDIGPEHQTLWYAVKPDQD